MSYANKFCFGSVVAVLAATPALAQDGDQVRLEEVIVTATRIETSLQDTAVAATALSGADIEQGNVRTLQDVSAYVPSMSVGNRAGEGGAGGAVSIRGMGVDAQDSSAAVGTYIDDVYFASNRGNILGMMDVERVEVLRGPQGTLFGRNAIAGAVQYVTVAPGNEFEGYLRGSGGEFGNNEFAGALNIPVSDTFALRVAGLYRENDGWVKDEFRDVDLGDADSTAIRVRAAWQPLDNLTVDLKFEHVEQSSEGVPSQVDGFETRALFYSIAENTAAIFGAPPIGLDASQISSQNDKPGDYTTLGINGPDSWDFEYDTYSMNLAYDINDNLTLHSITAYAEYSDRLLRDIDMTPLPILEVRFSEEETEVFTQELRLVGSALDERFQYTAGVYYFDGEERNTVAINTIGYPNLPLLGPPPPDVGPMVTNESFSVFAQGGYDITEDLTVTLGFRYTDEDVTSQEQQGITEESKFSFTDSTPYFGIDYRFNDAGMLYAKASKGFRAGGRRANFLLPGGGSDFDPEEAWTYEAGMRLEFLDGRARFNPTIYFTDWESIQFLNVVASPSGAPAVITQNAGDADIFGVELEGQFAVSANFLVRASYSYMDAEYSRVEPLTINTYPNGVTFISPAPGIPPVVPIGAVPELSLTKDTELQRAPKNKFTIGGVYTHDLNGRGQIVASADYLWTDKQRTLGLATALTMPSYGLLNSRVTYFSPEKKWSVSAYANNLTNEYYLIGGVDYAAGFTVGTRQIDLGRPREIGVAASFNF